MQILIVPWTPIIAALVTLAGVSLTILQGLKTTRRNLRANILSTNRIKWLDLFREEVPHLLTLGERIYERSPEKDDDGDDAPSERFRFVSKRLIVLLGREDELMVKLSDTVRTFAAAPTASLAKKIEILTQEVFRQQWNKVKAELGEPTRVRSLVGHDGPECVDSDATPAGSR